MARGSQCARWALVHARVSPACTRGCLRHPFACAACANVPGIGVSRVARIAGISRARCQRKHCRAMALQSALRLTPGSWASQEGWPRGREASQRNRTGPSPAQSRPMTRAASRHQTRALRPAPGPVSLKVVKVPFYSLQDGAVMLIRGGNDRRGMSRRGHMMAVRERPHSMSAPWPRSGEITQDGLVTRWAPRTGGLVELAHQISLRQSQVFPPGLCEVLGSRIQNVTSKVVQLIPPCR